MSGFAGAIVDFNLLKIKSYFEENGRRIIEGGEKKDNKKQKTEYGKLAYRPAVNFGLMDFFMGLMISSTRRLAWRPSSS
jgi:hypothetical protein